MREVRCLSDDMQPSEDCGEQQRPADREECHPEPCVPHIGQSQPPSVIPAFEHLQLQYISTSATNYNEKHDVIA